MKYFIVDEFRCKDGTAVPADLMPNVIKLMDNLNVIREYIGQPLKVLSGYRSPTWNKKVGGKKNSYHMKAMAADLTTKTLTPKQLHTKILKLIKEGKIKDGGLGLYPGFVHYDIGPSRRW